MDPNETAARPPLTTYEAVAGLLEHPLLRPELTTNQVGAAIERARRLGIAAVTVRPCDIDLAVRLLDGSPVKPASVAGFPHGSSTTAAKLYELRDLLRRGAKEIDAVINCARLLSREFQDVQTELVQMSESCRKEGAVLKVTLETHYLTAELKIVACQCCERADVHVVKTATGFGPAADSLDDLRLLRENLPDDIRIEAAPVATLHRVLEMYEHGCDRVGVTDPGPVLEEWRARLARMEDPGTTT
jgi:deoxyribose-phosphate aldolase